MVAGVLQGTAQAAKPCTNLTTVKVGQASILTSSADTHDSCFMRTKCVKAGYMVYWSCMLKMLVSSCSGHNWKFLIEHCRHTLQILPMALLASKHARCSKRLRFHRLLVCAGFTQGTSE